jgi:hypothetical protein
MNRGIYIVLLFIWLIFSAVFSFFGVVLIIETTIIGSLFGNALPVVGWGMVFGIFVVLQLLMHKSGALSLARIRPKEEKRTDLPRGSGSGWSGEQKDLTNVREDGAMRTTEVGNLSGLKATGGVAMNRSETAFQSSETRAPVMEGGSRPFGGVFDDGGNVNLHICPVCGGTGSQKVMGWKTVMETHTVYEQVTQFQFGKPVRVTMPRQVTKQVQKPDYKMINCYKCKGSGKV